jgi:succinate-semialdehyde dehydrogenase/glutarate-semialdehyde dehydrogenase
MPELPDASTLPSRLTPRQFDRWNDVATASADADRDVIAPFTGDVFAAAPDATPADVERAVADARDAQSRWADRDLDARTSVFERFHDLVLDRREELMDVMQLETGKSRGDAYVEVMDIAMTARYYATRVADQLASERRRAALPFLSTARVHHEPVGVVGIISPWNYPLTLAVGDAIPALLAGNSVVLKPAEETPYTALLTVALLREAGLPHDAFGVVPGEGEALGDPLIEAVDYVSFTGSTAVGRQIAAKAGEELVDCSLELGGKNPIYVRPDVDVDTAVDRAIGAVFSNAGQLCISGERLYVHEDVYDEFKPRFVDAVANLDLGAEYAYGVSVGSLISASQRERVKRHVADARDRGATVECGGEVRSDVGPYFYAPTVLTDLPADATAACEETFGPVVGMQPVESDGEAIREANDTDYGLHAAVLSTDVDRGRAIAREIDAGTVAVNDGYITAWAAHDAPMGGMGESGLGRRHGPEGVKRFTEAQTVSTSRFLPFDPVTGPSDVESKVLATGLKLWRHVPFLR